MRYHDLPPRLHGVLAILFLLGCSGKEDPSWRESLSYQPEEMHPLSIARNGVPQFDATINGLDVKFAFDTSSMTGLVIGSNLAAEIESPVVATSSDIDAQGNRVSYNTYNIASLRVWGLKLSGEKAFEDLNDMDQAKIGARFLADRRFTLNYRNKIMAISSSEMPVIPTGSIEIPLFPIPVKVGMPIIKGMVNGRPVLILFSTGLSRTSVDPSLIEELELPNEKDGFVIDRLEFGGLTVRLSNVESKSFARTNDLLVLNVPPPGATDHSGHAGHHHGADSETPQEIILIGLGSDVLADLLLTIDYRLQKMFISQESVK